MNPKIAGKYSVCHVPTPNDVTVTHRPTNLLVKPIRNALHGGMDCKSHRKGDFEDDQLFGLPNDVDCLFGNKSMKDSDSSSLRNKKHVFFSRRMVLNNGRTSFTGNYTKIVLK